MRRGGFLQKTEEALHKAGIETYTMEGIDPDPSIEKVREGAKAMEEFGPDVIIAIGGGSPIDAAKAMWVFYEYPELTFEEVQKPFSCQLSVRKLFSLLFRPHPAPHLKSLPSLLSRTTPPASNIRWLTST